jgi:hypothetical protein
MGKERPDAELGRPLYCTQFLKEQLKLTEVAAKARASVFGSDVKAAVRHLFPDYFSSKTTNRSVNGYDRETYLYFEAHLPAFHEALPIYLARSSEVKDSELSREGLAARKAQTQTSLNFTRVPPPPPPPASTSSSSSSFEGHRS